jgi:hypothetical protein
MSMPPDSPTDTDTAALLPAQRQDVQQSNTSSSSIKLSIAPACCRAAGWLRPTARDSETPRSPPPPGRCRPRALALQCHCTAALKAEWLALRARAPRGGSDSTPIRARQGQNTPKTPSSGPAACGAGWFKRDVARPLLLIWTPLQRRRHGFRLACSHATWRAAAVDTVQILSETEDGSVTCGHSRRHRRYKSTVREAQSEPRSEPAGANKEGGPQERTGQRMDRKR